MFTDDEARKLIARSKINRAQRGQPIMPKTGKRPEAYGKIRDTKVPDAVGTVTDMDQRVDGSGTEGFTAGMAAGGDYTDETAATAPKRSKYGNTRVEIDGKKFDSKHEAEVYQQLQMMLRVGEIKAVIRQVPFDLPGGIRYFADFGVIYPDNRVEFWDAKSPATAKNRVYINKKKQLRSEWGVEIIEV